MCSLPRWTGAVGLALIGAAMLAAPAQAATTLPPVVICDQSSTWQRPSPEAMARTVWRDPRYLDPQSGTVSPDELGFFTHHVLVLRRTSPAVLRRALDLTGLAGAHPRFCSPGARESADLGNPLQVWLLGDRLQAASRQGDTLRLLVAAGEGYAILEVPRTHLIRVTTPTGQEIARIDPADPAGDRFAAREARPDRALPPGFPRPAHYRAVLDGADSLHVETIGGQARATYARYLVPVAPGTTPRQVLRQYAAALRAAGFQVDPITSDPEAEALAFTFTASRGSPSAVARGRVTVSEPPDTDAPDAVRISLFLEYGGAPGSLPSAGGIPGPILPGAGLLGLLLLTSGLAARWALARTTR